MADELFEALVAQQGNKEGGTTEMVETSVENTETAVQEQANENVTTEMVTTETQEQVQENATEQATAVANYNEWLKNASDGLFEDEETFKGSLGKFREYDEKVQKISELEKNQLPDDAFVKTLANLRTNGATKDQITEFVKLNTEYEDFASMTPQQLMVAKMVLIDGYSKETAGRKVAREYDLSELDEDSEEYKDIKEEQRIASKKDLEALNSYKAQVSTVENLQEQKRLEDIAIKSAHEDNVRKTIPTFVDKINGLGKITFADKIGNEEVSSEMSFDFDDNFKKAIPQMLESYFNDEIAPITQERIDDAFRYIKADYLLNNYEKIVENVFKTALALGAEKTDNKYVNNKGVTETARETPTQDAKLAAEQAAFLKWVENLR